MRSPRNVELALLAAAAPVILLVFALVHGAARETLTWTDLAVPAALIAAFVAAHISVRLLAPAADPALLPITALLSGIGLAFVTRLDPKLAASQVVWLFAGVAALIGTLAIVRSLERLARYKYTIMLAGLFLLLLPAVIGHEVNGAKLWIRLGPMSFQPSEVAKVLIVLFLAAYLAENREVLSVSTRRSAGLWLPAGRHIGPVLAMWLVSLFVLVFQRDLGSSLLFFGVFLVMLFVATGRAGYVWAGLGLFTLGAVGAYSVFTHVQTRVEIWLDPFADAAGRGYQLVQSIFALAAGGMTGTGIGKGLPLRIPFVETDFIFSAIGEELGLLGGAAIIAAYLVFVYRGLATASRARSDMAAFTAVGLVAAFGLQTFVIIGGVTRLIPLTGITLPFVSYGGSSILANFILLGLLLRAGDETTEEELLSASDSGVLGRQALAGRVRVVGVAFSFLLLALVVNLTWLQVFQARALAANPANTRNLAEELTQERGAIVTSDGVVLAESVPDGSRFRRVYPEGKLAAHVVGYYSPRYGRTGIEAAANETLVGKRSFSTFQDVIDAAAGRPVPGNDVHLTIDSKIQKAAENALRGHRGAVVVIEPKSGRVLAMASSPSYDPGEVEGDWKSLSTDEDAPLLNRASVALYPPGSTFKTVTLTGAIANDVVTPETKYPGPATLRIGGGKVTNFESSGYGLISVERALTSSVNTVFAQMAVDMGPEALVRQAYDFGFSRRPPLEIPAKASVMTDPSKMSTWELAWAGVGQPVGDHRPLGPSATPLQMAMVASGIGNGGVVSRTYLIDKVADPSGRTVSRTLQRPYTTATDPATAQTVKDMMVKVVEQGSGAAAGIQGVAVAGKTGTAEVGKGKRTHAWFIAFAPADDPDMAMSIVLENSGVGGRVAAPAARGVLERAVQK